ncbi:hypothetical protein OUZ56_008160 [Daphnia magna]|uniref:Uncharacterized protein n=1 Tax=Daphnia magna TaxID=35525 RepID=A0ABR0AC93_9CRUS|nr:hypothetical protein OUZ56_008160 [Daphnia magna]
MARYKHLKHNERFNDYDLYSISLSIKCGPLALSGRLFGVIDFYNSRWPQKKKGGPLDTAGKNDWAFFSSFFNLRSDGAILAETNFNAHQNGQAKMAIAYG